MIDTGEIGREEKKKRGGGKKKVNFPCITYSPALNSLSPLF